MKNLITAIISSLLSISLSAQNVSMEEFMYSSGKINVVIAVVLIILVLIFIYLFRLDSKVKRMENGDD